MDGLARHWVNLWPGTDLWLRAVDLAPLSSDGFDFRSNTTSAMVNELKFAASKSVRTSFLILASFNAVAGAALAFAIAWDGYSGLRRAKPSFRLRSSPLSVVGPTETFPFILACAIVIQAIIFAAAQSKGLQSLLLLGCGPISQAMLPAIFIVPFTQLVFGLETMQRAFRPFPFPERLKWTVPTCLAITGLGLILACAVAQVEKPPNFCFGSLFWLLQRWTLGVFALLTAISACLLIGSVVIFTRLCRTGDIAEEQRTSASWMACYMVLAAVTLAIIAPFFWSIHPDASATMKEQQGQLGMAAVVSANLSGLTSGGLYILLRSTGLGSIGPSGYSEFDRQLSRRGKRPSTTGNTINYIYTKQMEQPVSPMRMGQDWVDLVDDEEKSTESLPATPASHGPDLGSAVASTYPTSPPSKAPDADVVSPTTGRTRKPSVRRNSYSIFPSAHDPKPTLVLPPAVYNPKVKPSNEPLDIFSVSDLMPPPMIRTSRHLRNTSLGSTATVQIGLRVSNLDDMPPVTSYYEAPYPYPRPETPYPRPETPYPRESKFPETLGLAISTDAVSASPPPPSVGTAKGVAGPAEKQLPPVPLKIEKKNSRRGLNERMEEEEMRLGPSVYSPPPQTSKLSRKGTVNTSPRGSPTRAPPPGPIGSEQGRTRVQSVEWI
ncbi:hypothetical protein RJ55_00262 [Drechmeria coniospora]|nr:hypothetical protein RJ55_00262 [Drechmeria coniospora]